jgi:CheY-like chemotaxis protein
MQHRVLVVDDDREIRETLVAVLEDLGVNAVSAGNGQEALERLREGAAHPCMIFLDLMMPVMDGRGFREAQLNSPALREIPVVILSAYRDVDAIATGLGVERVLRKPLNLNDLRSSVEAYCGPVAEA